MSIRPNVNLAAMNKNLSLLDTCRQEAPEGMFTAACELSGIIGDTCDELIKTLNAAGYKTENCDGIREIEALIYDWVRRSNPDNLVFAEAEGFGRAIQTEAAPRVRAQLIRDRDFIRSTRQNAGSIPANA